MTYSVSKRATTKYYLIPIQSFSDVITNSSSEIFCTISGGAIKAGLEAILDKYFKDNYTIEYE